MATLKHLQMIGCVKVWDLWSQLAISWSFLRLKDGYTEIHKPLHLLLSEILQGKNKTKSNWPSKVACSTWTASCCPFHFEAVVGDCSRSGEGHREEAWAFHDSLEFWFGHTLSVRAQWVPIHTHYPCSGTLWTKPITFSLTKLISRAQSTIWVLIICSFITKVCFVASNFSTLYTMLRQQYFVRTTVCLCFQSQLTLEQWGATEAMDPMAVWRAFTGKPQVHPHSSSNKHCSRSTVLSRQASGNKIDGGSSIFQCSFLHNYIKINWPNVICI